MILLEFLTILLWRIKEYWLNLNQMKKKNQKFQIWNETLIYITIDD